MFFQGFSRNTPLTLLTFPLFVSKVKQQFHDAGLMADVDVDPGCTLNKKIRNAQLAQCNFILGNNVTVFLLNSFGHFFF